MADVDLEDELDLTDEEREKRRLGVGTPIMPSRYDSGSPRVPASASVTPGLDAAKLDTTPPDIPSQPESIGTPIAPTQQQPGAPRPLYDEYQRQLNNKAGVQNLHGFGGGLVKGLEAIGSVISPGAMMAIPGTRFHHQLQVNNAARGAEEENKEIASQEEEKLRGAQTEEQRALADKNRKPPEKVGTTPEETTIHDLMTGNGGAPRVNPKTQQPYTYMDAYTDVMMAKAGTKPPQKPDAPEQQYIDEYQQKHPGSSVQEAIKAYKKDTEKEPTGSWMPLYDEKGNVTGAWNATTGETKKSPGGLPGKTAPGSHIGTAAEAAMEKKVAPLRGIVEEADKAATLKDLADKGNAEADVDLALTFFKTMRSAQQGGSGIRFTQQENNLIMGARSLWGGLEVKGNQIFSNGEPLSKVQRQQILDVINVHKQAAQRQLQELQSGGAQPSPETHPGTGIQIQRDASGRIVGVS